MEPPSQPAPLPTLDMAARLDPGRYRLDPWASREWADYGLSVKDQTLQVAADHVTGQHVLLRSVAIDATASLEVRLELLRAARTATAFHHPAILPLLDVGESDGHLIFVQPLPRAPLLHHSIAEVGAFSWSTLDHAVRPFLEGMAAARAAGFNVPLISPQDFVLVGRGGFNPRRLVSLSPLVPLGWTLQTANPLFAAPGELEDAEGNIVSAIYSAGALFTYMMAGRTPAPGENWAQIVAGLELPSQVRPILQSMLEKEPILRPREATHIVQWLEDIAQGRTPGPIHSRQRRLLLPETLREAIRQAPAVARAHRIKGIALAVGTLPVLALGAWNLLHPSRHAGVIATMPSMPAHRVTQANPAALPSQPAENLEETSAPAWLVTEYRPKARPTPARQVPRLSPSTASLAVQLTSPPSVASARLALPTEEPRRVSLRQDFAATASALLARVEPIIPRAIPVAIPIAEPFLGTTAHRVQIVAAPPPTQVLASLSPAESTPRSSSARDQVAQLMRASSLDAAQRTNLRTQAQRLQRNGDPLGDSALGYVTLREAEAAPRLSDCRALLTRAIPLLKKATADGQAKAAYHLIQACLNQYNLERQAGHQTASDQASRGLSDVLTTLPREVPARELNQLASQIEHTLDLREKQGHPHPQASYNRSVALALRTLAQDR